MNQLDHTDLVHQQERFGPSQRGGALTSQENRSVVGHLSTFQTANQFCQATQTTDDFRRL